MHDIDETVSPSGAPTDDQYVGDLTRLKSPLI